MVVVPVGVSVDVLVANDALDGAEGGLIETLRGVVTGSPVVDEPHAGVDLIGNSGRTAHRLEKRAHCRRELRIWNQNEKKTN